MKITINEKQFNELTKFFKMAKDMEEIECITVNMNLYDSSDKTSIRFVKVSK